MADDPPAPGPADYPSIALRDVVDSLPAMVGYWDTELRNRFANRAYLDWFGMPPEQMRGRHILELLGPEIFAKNLPYIEAALRGEVQQFERTIPGPRGIRHSSALYLPDRRPDGTIAGFFVQVTDVTHLKEVEAQLQAARDELELRVEERTRALTVANEELARSNAELARFAYVASHDLQEPVRTIASYCELLEERYGSGLDDRGRRYLRHAADAAHRMQGVIRAVLEVSQVGRAGQPMVRSEPAEAVRVAMEALASGIADAHATIIVEPLPAVIADPGELVLLFQNLLANAIKFRGADPPEVRVSGRVDGGSVEISVSDNGIGIEPEHTERIFKMFQRLHADTYPGTGMGLALARKIVEGHGGALWVESTPGAGATLRFTMSRAVSDG